MEKNKKRRDLAHETEIVQNFRRWKRGIGETCKRPVRLMVLVLTWIGLLTVWMLRHQALNYTAGSFLAPLLDLLLGLFLLIVGMTFLIVFPWLWGAPLYAGQFQDNLHRIGFVNAAGEAPTLLSEAVDSKNPNIHILVFHSIGLPIAKWLDCTDALQAALNITIADIRQGENNQHIVVSAAPPATGWSVLHWSDFLLPLEDTVLLLGRSVLGDVTVDLSKTPHILLGGSTGSGKTGLLKLMLRQAVCHGMEVHIADFKGGVDFGPWFRDNCDISYDMDKLMETLDHFVEVLDKRKVLLSKANCANIGEYNARHGHHLRRMVFACDEVAELLDKSGKSKAQKEAIDQVTDRLSTLARLGRAFGLHLILSTQRPDATVLPGQLRSNIEFRACGRADRILSDIIIDSTAAADLIPKDAQGRFVLNDALGGGQAATVFQAFLLPDRFM